MKTLFLTNTYLKGDNGGIYATRAYINAFAILSESMTLMYAMKDGAEPCGILESGINMIPVWDYRTRARKFVDLCLGITNRFQKKFFELINIGDFDTIVFNNSEVSSGLVGKCRKKGIRTITIHHNYQIEYIWGDGEMITLFPRLLWTFIYERSSVRNSDLNLTLTDDDIRLLRNHYGKGCFDNIGVFEYKSLPTKTFKEEPRKHRYVITGGLGSKQTEDSIIPWIKKYYPVLKRVDPKACLTIAGKSPSDALVELAIAAGIDVIPSPIDMQPILDNADYYICPTDRGGGLKLRNMDGLKSGLIVLSHVVSTRGYEDMQNRGNVLSYSNIEEFKDGLIKLLSCDKSKRQVFEEYKKYYSFEVGVKRLSDILRDKLGVDDNMNTI